MSDEQELPDRARETAFRPMTPRERAVLELMLSVDFQGVGELRRQSKSVLAAMRCPCGCPSVDFAHPPTMSGMEIRVNAEVENSDDGLFLFTHDGWLGGIEWVGFSDEPPEELPDPALLRVELAASWPPT